MSNRSARRWIVVTRRCVEIGRGRTDSPEIEHVGAGHPGSGHPGSGHPGARHPGSGHPETRSPELGTPRGVAPSGAPSTIGRPVSARSGTDSRGAGRLPGRASGAAATGGAGRPSADHEAAGGFPGSGRPGARRPYADYPDPIVPRTISLDEWLSHVAVDPALEPVRLAANEDDALRDAHPVRVVDRSTDRWLYWMAGELWATMPDPAMLATMQRVARALAARVRDDNQEYFRKPSVIRLDGEFDPGCLRSGTDEATGVLHTSERRDEEEAIVERQARQVLIVAGTVVCVASVMWLMQA